MVFHVEASRKFADALVAKRMSDWGGRRAVCAEPRDSKEICGDIRDFVTRETQSLRKTAADSDMAVAVAVRAANVAYHACPCPADVFGDDTNLWSECPFRDVPWMLAHSFQTCSRLGEAVVRGTLCCGPTHPHGPSDRHMAEMSGDVRRMYGRSDVVTFTGSPLGRGASTLGVVFGVRKELLAEAIRSLLEHCSYRGVDAWTSVWLDDGSQGVSDVYGVRGGGAIERFGLCDSPDARSLPGPLADYLGPRRPAALGIKPAMVLKHVRDLRMDKAVVVAHLVSPRAPASTVFADWTTSEDGERFACRAVGKGDACFFRGHRTASIAERTRDLLGRPEPRRSPNGGSEVVEETTAEGALRIANVVYARSLVWGKGLDPATCLGISLRSFLSGGGDLSEISSMIASGRLLQLPVDHRMTRVADELSDACRLDPGVPVVACFEGDRIDGFVAVLPEAVDVAVLELSKVPPETLCGHMVAAREQGMVGPFEEAVSRAGMRVVHFTIGAASNAAMINKIKKSLARAIEEISRAHRRISFPHRGSRIPRALT